MLSQDTRGMDEGVAGSGGVEGARERGVEVRKRDLRASGKRERGRNGERMREEGRGFAGKRNGKDCWDRRLGHWTDGALERNARSVPERTWGAEARHDVK